MPPSNSFLPYGRHFVDKEDLAAIAKVFDSGFLTTGQVVSDFEDAFSAKTGAEHAVVCSSGTAALHLAAMALKLGEGDVAIVPSITFLATANALRMVGVEVVFSDVDPNTGLMRPEDLLNAILRADTNKLKAVFPVHYAGQSPHMEEISSIARENGLFIVEDACHALGSTYGKSETFKVGSCRHSDLAIFSFHPVKHIAMGEGGAVCTNDQYLAKRVELLRNHGMVRDPSGFTNKQFAFSSDGNANPWYYEMHELGYNYRASDIHCALGLSQLKKFSSFSKARKNLASHYDALFKNAGPYIRPLARCEGSSPVWHLYVLLIEFEEYGITRDALMKELKSKNIGTQVHYIPLHQQPYYRNRYGDVELPGASRFYERCLSIPLFPAMGIQDIEYVVNTIKSILN